MVLINICTIPAVALCFSYNIHPSSLSFPRNGWTTWRAVTEGNTSIIKLTNHETPGGKMRHLLWEPARLVDLQWLQIGEKVYQQKQTVTLMSDAFSAETFMGRLSARPKPQWEYFEAEFVHFIFVSNVSHWVRPADGSRVKVKTKYGQICRYVISHSSSFLST